jgi:ATP-binding cassette subfamily F protein 3
MNSVQMLIDALSKFDGTYVLVSHDRYFVSQTANKILEIVDGEIKEFKGTYTEWEDFKKRQQEALKLQAAANKAAAGADSNESKKKEVKAPQVNYTPVKGVPIDKDKKKELQKQQRQFQQLEEQLAGLNEKKASLEASLNNPEIYADKKRFQQVESEYAQIGRDLKKANEEYEKAFEKLMELEG